VLVVFDNVNGVYQVRVRSLKYVFESVRETDFYFDSQTRIYDSRTGRTVSDKVTVLKNQPRPNHRAITRSGFALVYLQSSD
jgi:hypothetical protein